ncbi:phenol-soluble modulin export ABC transporter permease subunit PmtD [Staphylococcus simulans]|uniref:phenol-soluble modulin export ABC transporter permease subunit PmtD n=1 Tax=Staphylococcus simulans TaxID=1286 RepID=UPI00399ADE31
MNLFQLVKHDIISILRSPLTYLALLLTLLPIIGMTALINQQMHKVDGDIILSMGSWFFSIVGLLFMIKTITRDISQGTIQLYLNKTSNRIKYFIAKVLSITFIAILITVLLDVIVLLIQAVTKGPDVKDEKMIQILWFYFIFLLFFGLLLFLVALVVPKPALIYALGIFLVLIVPFAEPFLPMIPKIGDDIQKSLKYIPFSYLTNKTTTGNYKFSNWQWFISSASIVVFFIANALYITKKDI